MTTKTLSDLLQNRTGRTTTLEQVVLWLSQDEVRDLVGASWDPALDIRHHDLGMITRGGLDLDEGQGITWHGRGYAAECRVRTKTYVVELLAAAHEELGDHHWLLAETALRERLLHEAIGLK